MAQAVSNRVRLSVVEEVTQGVTPATPTLQTLRVTSVGLKPNPKNVVSQQLVSDRMEPDYIFVGLDAAGDVGIEWIADAHAILIEGAMMKDYTVAPELSGTGSITAVTAATDNYTIVAGTFVRYDLVRGEGFTLAANNGTFVAQATTSSTSLVTLDGRATETPTATARLKQIGFEGPTTDINATASGLASTLIDFTSYGLTPGQWVVVGGTATANKFATATSNGYCRVSTSTAITATALPFDVVQAGFGVDAGTGKNIRVYFGDYITNSTTLKTYTFERFFADITQYELFKGCAVDALMLDAKPQSVLTGSVSLIGMNYGISGTQVAGAVMVAAKTSDVLNASSNVAYIAENGVTVGTPNYVFGLQLSFKNNVRLLTAVGSLTGIGVNYGTFQVAGRLEAYFGDSTLLAKVLSQTSTSLYAGFSDANGKGILFDLPKVKFGGGGVDVTGLNEDLKQPLDLVALKFTPLLTAVSPYAASISHFEGIGT